MYVKPAKSRRDNTEKGLLRIKVKNPFCLVIELVFDYNVGKIETRLRWNESRGKDETSKYTVKEEGWLDTVKSEPKAIGA